METQPIRIPHKTNDEEKTVIPERVVHNIFKIQVHEDSKTCVFISRAAKDSTFAIFKHTLISKIEEITLDTSYLLKILQKDVIHRPDEVVISKNLSKMAYINNDKIIIWDLIKVIPLGKLGMSMLKCPIFSPRGNKLFIKDGDYEIVMIDLQNIETNSDATKQVTMSHQQIVPLDTSENIIRTEDENEKYFLKEDEIENLDSDIKQILFKSNQTIHSYGTDYNTDVIYIVVENTQDKKEENL